MNYSLQLKIINKTKSIWTLGLRFS
jgi:hypothetical protein